MLFVVVRGFKDVFVRPGYYARNSIFVTLMLVKFFCFLVITRYHFLGCPSFVPELTWNTYHTNISRCVQNYKRSHRGLSPGRFCPRVAKIQEIQRKNLTKNKEHMQNHSFLVVPYFSLVFLRPWGPLIQSYQRQVPSMHELIKIYMKSEKASLTEIQF